MIKRDSSKDLVFVPLGGVHEIGMNLALYGYGSPSDRQWIVVDAGVSFLEEKHLGVDLVMPDVSFIMQNISGLKAVVITHGHEDHYGALRDLGARFGVPVWMSPFVAGLFESKKDYGKKKQSKLSFPDIKLYKPGDVFQIGPFSIEAISVAHSIPESMALAITTPAGVVVHTGDWRIDPHSETGDITDEARFRALGDEGVLALICDSTNALKKGESASELALALSLKKIMQESEKRVVIGIFSSNVGRVISIARMAKEVGRQVLLMGRSLRRVADVATELGYFDGIPEFLESNSVSSIQPQKLVVVCTGSQGEENATLAKLSRDEIQGLSLRKRDTVVFSSRAIPGNEKAILAIKNRFVDRGIKIIEEDEALIHVSGHAGREELQKMYAWTRPQIGVPVHGEPIHLAAQASLMSKSGISKVVQIRNGDVLRLSPGDPFVSDQISWGRLYRDGNFLGNAEEMALEERRKLAFAGHVLLVVELGEGYMIEDIQVLLCGVPNVPTPVFFSKGQEAPVPAVKSTEDFILDALEDAFLNLSSDRRNINFLYDMIVRVAGAEVKRLWGKKPVVDAFLRGGS